MYVPSAFAEERTDVLHEFLETHGFATLISVPADGGEPIASHVPMLLDRSRGPHGLLQTHLARQNDHSENLASGSSALAIFSGPHAYISPRWYANPVSVPTWNYVVVHAYGRPRMMNDDELRDHLNALVAKYEPGERWNAAKAFPPDVLEKLQRQVVGFEMEITRLQGKWKLGQNRTREDRQGAIEGLRGVGGEDANAVADLMAATLQR